jgi:hypothetical protein
MPDIEREYLCVEGIDTRDVPTSHTRSRISLRTSLCATDQTSVLTPGVHAEAKPNINN